MLGKSSWIMLKAEVSQVLLARAFTQSVASGEAVKPWNWADTWPVAEITLPRIGEKAIVLHGATPESLAFGPAHVSETPRPGERGTSVIAAHRDTHFSFIKDLKPGDLVELTTKTGRKLTYRMTGSAIVHAQASGIAPRGKTPRLALVTCYPFDGVQRGPLRYIVFAEAVKY